MGRGKEICSLIERLFFEKIKEGIAPEDSSFFVYGFRRHGSKPVLRLKNERTLAYTATVDFLRVAEFTANYTPFKPEDIISEIKLGSELLRVNHDVVSPSEVQVVFTYNLFNENVPGTINLLGGLTPNQIYCTGVFRSYPALHESCFDSLDSWLLKLADKYDKKIFLIVGMDDSGINSENVSAERLIDEALFSRSEIETEYASQPTQRRSAPLMLPAPRATSIKELYDEFILPAIAARIRGDSLGFAQSSESLRKHYRGTSGEPIADDLTFILANVQLKDSAANSLLAAQVEWLAASEDPNTVQDIYRSKVIQAARKVFPAVQ